MFDLSMVGAGGLMGMRIANSLLIGMVANYLVLAPVMIKYGEIVPKNFAKIVQDAMTIPNLQHGREGLLGERPANEIGMHAIRAGDNVGEHTIIFSALGETMELVHKGYSRDSYARGALSAAKFLANKPAGKYTMADVLGL